MDKILNDFYNIASIESKVANFIWIGGMVVNTLVYFLLVINFDFKIYIAIYVLVIFLLLILSNSFFMKKASKKIGIQTSFFNCFNPKHIRFVYKKIDEFQKDWITKYCKKNKLNNIEKLNIIRQELKFVNESKTTRYINPLIIGTLLISAWEVTIERIVDKYGFWNMLLIAIVIIIGLSIFIGWIKKIYTEDKEFLLQYNYFSNIKRLEELVLYRILKCKK